MAIKQTPPFRTRILNAVLWSIASTGSSKLIDFVVLLVLARLLTPADFGLIALVTIYIAFGNVFVQGGFAQAIIQRDEIEDLHLDTAFWTSLAVGVLLTVCTFIFGPPTFEYLFKEPILASIVEVTSVLFTVAALQSVQQALLTRRLQFKQLAIRRAVGALAGGVTAITLAFLGFGVWSLVALRLVSAIVGLILLWTASNWRPRRKFSIPYFHDLFAFGIHIVGGQLIAFFNRRGIDLFIGVFLGTTALGYFVLASRIVLSVLSLVTTAIQSVAFPTFSRLQNNQRKLCDAFYQAVRFTSLVSFPLFLGISSTALLLVSMLLGPQWTPIVPVLQILCFLGILDSITRYTYSAILACGKANWQLYISIFNAIAIYIGFFVAVEWGIVAVAVARVAIGILIAPVGLLAARRLVRFTYGSYFGQLIPASVASIVMISVILITQTVIPDDVAAGVELSALALLGATTYAISIYFVDRSILRDALGMLVELWPALGRRNAKERR